MNATACGQQLSKPDLVDRTVQSSTADGGQKGLSRERRLTKTAEWQISARANNIQGAASIMSDILDSLN